MNTAVQSLCDVNSTDDDELQLCSFPHILPFEPRVFFGLHGLRVKQRILRPLVIHRLLFYIVCFTLSPIVYFP